MQFAIMNIDAEDDYFRVPSSSSSFFALASLEPPSPTVSTSRISSLSLDDIPVFLVDSVEPDSVHTTPDCQPFASADDLTCLPADNSIGSFVSVCSFGTFGPKNRHSTEEIGEIALPKSVPTEAIPSTVMSINAHDARVLIDDIVSLSNSLHSSLEISAETRDLTDLSASPKVAETLAVSERIIPAGDSSISTERPRGTQVAKSDVAPTNKTHASRRNEMKNNPMNKPHSLHPLQQGDPKPPKSHALTRNPRRTGQDQVEFVWLHGISIDLLIDQEGFRSAIPSFKYFGVDNAESRNGNGRSVIFRPATKQTFYFHYNIFDSLPVLRRLTVHGEDSRDYISKQAQLTLKSNGIYSVHGAEVSSLLQIHSQAQGQQGHDSDLKLEWQFHYLIDDRVDAHRRIVDGEKKFVPLTFTCSPWLLHPSQGKRINLMHVFKKGVSTKLMAEKLTPLPLLRSATTASSETRSGDQDVGLVAERHSLAHRRVQSHAVHDSATNEFANFYQGSPEASFQTNDEPADTGVTKLINNSPHKIRTRRRASSAGEGSILRK